MPTIRESLEAETRAWRAKYDLCVADPRKGGNARDADLKAMHEHSAKIFKLVESMSLPANATEVTRLNGMDLAQPGPGEGSASSWSAGSAGGHGAGGNWATVAAEAFAKAMPADTAGRKSLVSGTIGLPSPIAPEVVNISQVPRRILDLLPRRALEPGQPYGGGNTFTYLKQTVRTNNAAFVADAADKPTSVYTVAEVEDRVRVLAHLSESVPERYFADFAQLEGFLRSEMQYGLEKALETNVVSGAGTGETLTGILTVAGTTPVAYATDLLTTSRNALTALEALGVVPTAYVFNPSDAATLDLVREGAGTGQFMLGGPGGASGPSLWGIPRVSSLAVPVGQAILADWTQAEIVVREDAMLAVDRSGAHFVNNTVVLRLEGRFGFAVKRPSSFAIMDLTS